MSPSFALAILLLAPAAGASELSPVTADSGRPMAPEQRAVEFANADLAFRVDPAAQRIDGDATLVLRARESLPRVVLDLDPALTIAAIAVDGRELARSAWSNPEGRLSISLPTPVASGAEVTLRIRYGGKPHVARHAPWDGGFVWAKAPTGEPWIGTAVEGEGCDLFWPCIDHPMGEPAMVTEHVTVPAPLVAAGNGVLLGMDEKDGWRTWHWRAKQPDTYAVSLNIGPYELLSDDYRSRFGNTIPLRFWYLKGNEAKAKELFSELTPMLDFFEGTIGPYPFGDEKVGMVETPYLGMEHQTVNAYGNGYKKDAFGFDWLLQHEFAHEWFGNQLTNRDWDDMWLHEGFGSYMQPLYLRYLRGDMAYYAWLHKQRSALVNRVPMVSGRSQVEEAVYNEKSGPGNDIYYKGALLLHSLRELIGDDAFYAAVRRLVYGRPDPRPGNFAPRYGTSREFIQYVNDATGKDYGWFFDVYLFRAALPVLESTRDASGLRLRWKAPDDLPFPMPVEVRVGERVETVPMTAGEGFLAVPADALVTLDPHSKLLRAEPHIEAYQQFMKEQAAARPKVGGKQ